METMHAAGRRRLPPVPRLGGEPAVTRFVGVATERFVLGPPSRELPSAPVPVADVAERARDEAQRFVERLRSAAADFAAAAGAESAVVREAVPPARHRRSRCRVVLRFTDGAEVDTTFLGPPGAPPEARSRHGFDRQIRRWLAAGLLGDDSWPADDTDAEGGRTVDLTAWISSA